MDFFYHSQEKLFGLNNFPLAQSILFAAKLLCAIMGTKFINNSINRTLDNILNGVLLLRMVISIETDINKRWPRNPKYYCLYPHPINCFLSCYVCYTRRVTKLRLAAHFFAKIYYSGLKVDDQA